MGGLRMSSYIVLSVVGTSCISLSLSSFLRLLSPTGEGHDKRQCTVQLTIFADGEPRIKPLLIFKGTGQRIPDREKRQYDPRVVVKFQENAWCNEQMMVFWLRNMWKKPNMFGQPRDRLLTYDAHRAQTTERVKTIL